VNRQKLVVQLVPLVHWLTNMNEYSVVMVNVSSILILQQIIINKNKKNEESYVEHWCNLHYDKL
jgi:hypothetical protein